MNAYKRSFKYDVSTFFGQGTGAGSSKRMLSKLPSFQELHQQIMGGGAQGSISLC